MDGVHGKGGEADCYVFGAAFVGSGVADPLAGMGNDGLSRRDVKRSILMLDAERPFEDDGELVEAGSLAGLKPTCGAAHVGDTGRCGSRVDASDVFVDDLGLVADRLDAGGLRDQSGHWF